MSHDYTHPVARLLDYGEPASGGISEAWPDYPALGLRPEDVPELLRLAEDAALNSADPESPEVWAPIHAWRALAQLGAVETAPALLRLMQRNPHDDWLAEELPYVMSRLGPATIPAVEAALADPQFDARARISVPGCLKRIGIDHPAQRQACVRGLERQLERHAANEAMLNGVLIANLLDFEARESIGAIRAAFAAGHVDPFIAGDLEEVEIALGLRTARLTPRPRHSWFDGVPDPMRAAPWFDDGDKVPSATATNPRRRVGRNDPCPCGSGRKFKRCCGRS